LTPLSENDAVLVIYENGEVKCWVPGDKDEDSFVPGHGLLIAQIAIALRTKPDELLDFLEKCWE